MEKSAESSTPEFEFWSFPQPQDLLTADELFADGVILPLNHPLSSNPDPAAIYEESINPAPPASATPPPKKWKQIFRSRNARKATAETKEKAKSAATPASSSSAELNIHIWPFSRSRSAGNATARPRPLASSARKSCSAPCSRSNSRGESPKPTAGKKWGPLAGGIHVGRSMPVWQLRRSVAGNGASTNSNNIAVGGNCRVEDKDAVAGGDRNGGGKGGSLFSLRAIFSKKVY